MAGLLNVGIKGESSVVVNDKNTAIAYGSGTVNVFATPAMAALMENAAISTSGPQLEAGFTTVGTQINIKHLAATPIGMKVTATAELMEIDGKRLLFKVEARDEVDLIGTGMHERYVVQSDIFIKRATDKLARK
ncbi:MAG: Fluoroacetyl-CoA thioesterase [Pelotomaculum sp. PtaB.Bin104]|nr:MAG: Fluoroacetyl-CoA thioesterase [Pelotomaculum sp. PtaB.Bin104]